MRRKEKVSKKIPFGDRRFHPKLDPQPKERTGFNFPLFPHLLTCLSSLQTLSSVSSPIHFFLPSLEDVPREAK